MDPIAIVGIGCRFPGGAHDPNLFWRMLYQGTDAIREVSPDRWELDALEPVLQAKPHIRWGGFLDQVDCFDANFFQIAAAEAEYIDPQQRLVLEVAWEALENAAIDPAQLAEAPVGVFVGVSNGDYNRLLYQYQSGISVHTGVGTAFAIVANRLSYLLNLRGPSIVVDTACSSSLVAVHLACQSLHRSESKLCLVGGVNLILSPEHSIASAQAQMMAADGRCKTFDAAADGYVRGEGCGIVVLKRLADAQRDHDRILAVIRGSAVNHDGYTNGLTAPNGLSQQMLIRQALAEAGVNPDQISYVETHGTGTALGDVIEVKAIKSVLMEGRSSDQTCWISSVKTNIGHLEAASGIAELIKVALALHHEAIPPHLHLKTINPLLPIKQTPIQIPTEVQPWLRGSEPRIAGVSSFAIGGANAHVILAEAPESEAILGSPSGDLEDRPHHVLTLSAKTPQALRDLVKLYQNHLEVTPDQPLPDLCFTANTGRSHFDHRLAILAESIPELRQRLAVFCTDHSDGDVQMSESVGSSDGMVWNLIPRKQPPKVAFYCPNFADLQDDPIPVNLGYALYRCQPNFRRALEECDRILQRLWNTPLLRILYPDRDQVEEDFDPVKPSDLELTSLTQVIHFGLGYALAQMWKAWGVSPSALVAQGSGRCLAACLAGIYDLETALQFVVGSAQVDPSIQSSSDQERAIQLKSWATQVTYAVPRIPVLDDDHGLINPEDLVSSEYWSGSRSQASHLDPALAWLKQKNYSILLSLGMGSEDLPGTPKDPEGSQALLWLQSMPGRSPILGSEWILVLETLARLYAQGVGINWQGFDAPYPRFKLILPTYPWQRQRYWFDPNFPQSQESKSSTATASSTGTSTQDQKGTLGINTILQNPGSAGGSRIPQMSAIAMGSSELQKPNGSQFLDPASPDSQERMDRLLQWLRGYAADQINSRLIDERRCIPPYVVLDFGNQGLLGMQVPQSYGGIGLTHRDTFRMFEQLGAIDVTLASFVGVHHVLGTRPILRWAQPHLRDHLLPRIAQGRDLAAFAITEPGAGSNPRAIASTATATGPGRWKLQGQKIWIGSGSWASVTNVFVQTVDEQQKPLGITGFVVQRGAEGFRQGPEALTMGMRGMVQNSLHFQDVPVTSEGLLGSVGEGLTVAQDAMMFGRLALGAVSLGGIKRCTQIMLRYSSRRSVSTGRLLDNPVTLVCLGHLTAAATAVESLVFTVAELLDQGFPVPEELYGACKTTGPELYWQATDQLVQLLGGRGYIETNMAPQMLRDARLLRIFEGPTEALNMFLGSRLVQKGEQLDQFLAQTLGVPAVAQRLGEAVGSIQERFNQRSRFGASHTTSRWIYSCVGELTNWVILLAVVQARLQRLRDPSLDPSLAQRLQRAATWADLQFQQKLQQILIGSPEEQVVCGAGAITAEIQDYTASIGLVEQTLAGEDRELDEWLRPEDLERPSGDHSLPKRWGNGFELDLEQHPAYQSVDYQSVDYQSADYQSADPSAADQAAVPSSAHQPVANQSADPSADHNREFNGSDPGDPETNDPGDSPQLYVEQDLPRSPPLSVDTILEWAEQWLRQQPGIEAAAIDPRVSFADYGMDSVLAVELVQGLEAWLRIPLDATLIWNFPTLETLAQYLFKEINPHQTSVTSNLIQPGSNQGSNQGSELLEPLQSKDLEESGDASLDNSLALELAQLETLLGD